MENQQEQEQAMMQDNAQNQAEIERVEKENKVLEQQAAQNRVIRTRRSSGDAGANDVGQSTC